MSYQNLIERLKGGQGSGNFGHSGIPGKVGGSAPGSGGGGGSLSMNVIGRAASMDNPDWKRALGNADRRAVNEITSALPGATVEKIEGGYIREPRVSGTLHGSSIAAITSDLKSKGWKAPSKFEREASRTFVSPDGHQLTISKYGGTGGGRSIDELDFGYYPSYANSAEFDVP